MTADRWRRATGGGCGCGRGGGCELALEDLIDAGGQFFDGAAQAVGYAFVGAGGGDEALPPRERHCHALPAGVWAIQ